MKILDIQEYYIDEWVKSSFIGTINEQIQEIEAINATMISLHIQELDEESELQDRYIDIKKGHKLWS